MRYQSLPQITRLATAGLSGHVDFVQELKSGCEIYSYIAVSEVIMIMTCLYLIIKTFCSCMMMDIHVLVCVISSKPLRIKSIWMNY